MKSIASKEDRPPGRSARSGKAAAAIAAAALAFAGELQAAETAVTIRADQPGPTINRNIYGHFSEHLGRCIYGGYWVGEDSPIPNVRGIRVDVVQALRKLHPPVLRWPGGCFADTYHWKDAVGPRDRRKPILNVHWGNVLENNHFGTHEFMDLCEQLGAEPYFCANVGSGTVQELADWVEYTTYGGRSPMADWRRANGREEPWKIRYWGIGNENWGCGGNMTPEYYARLFRRYATYVRSYPGNRVFKIACGANSFDYRWTEVLMRDAGRYMNGLSLHYYCGSGKKSRSATRFDEGDWFFQLRNALRMEELLRRHIAIMDRYDPRKRVALIVDEWGAWHAVEPGTNPGFLYQQNSLRDAMVAALTLNIFHRHADRVRMANIAQTVNVLQAMILTDGPRMLTTPTYHVFEMYKVHQGATYLPAAVECPDYAFGGEKIPQVSVSASEDKQGRVHISLVNVDPNRPAPTRCRLEGFRPGRVSGRILTAPEMQAHNTFDRPDYVKPAPFGEARIDGGAIVLRMPPKSIIVLEASGAAEK
ncbi:MAG: alpha-N-arabinofuranosidase [Verrucomicrobia bacterium]|nr:alpha-N-arabinofuranosidase [Verrucomicrobiota bacterium]